MQNGAGVRIEADNEDNAVVGNLISGNRGDGVAITRAYGYPGSDNRIEGNVIGLDVNGNLLSGACGGGSATFFSATSDMASTSTATATRSLAAVPKKNGTLSPATRVAAYVSAERMPREPGAGYCIGTDADGSDLGEQPVRCLDRWRVRK